MKTVIVLDIDGVLNSERFYQIRGKNYKYQGDEYFLNDIDPYSVRCLNKLIDHFRAELLISSSWRIGETVESFTKKLKQMKVSFHEVNLTPVLKEASLDFNFKEEFFYKMSKFLNCIHIKNNISDHIFTKKFNERAHRGKEIKTYLQSHFKGQEINLIILDDDKDMGELLPYLWQTSKYSGLDEDLLGQMLRTKLKQYKVD